MNKKNDMNEKKIKRQVGECSVEIEFNDKKNEAAEKQVLDILVKSFEERIQKEL